MPSFVGFFSTGLYLPMPIFVSFFFYRTLLPNAKVCGFLLPQDFPQSQVSWVSFPQDFISQCQVSWVSSSTGLYLPMPSFVGFFFHRTLSPNAKFRGFLFPQDFISQC